MGAAASTNVAKTCANSVSNVLTNVVNNVDLNASSSQSIVVSETNGNVVISGNTLSNQYFINMKEVARSLTDSNVRSAIALEVAQQAKSLVKDINLGNVSAAGNIVDDAITETIKISNNISATCGAKLNVNQSITVTNTTGSVTIEGNSLSSAMSIFEDCMVDQLSQNSTISAIQSKIDEKASASTSGVSVWGLATIGGIILLGIVAVTALPTVLPFIVAGKRPKILGLIVLLIGIAFIIVYFTWTSTEMKSTLWGKSIIDTCDVNNQEFFNYDTTITTADEAIGKCNNDKNCQGYDFVSMSYTGGEWNELNRKTTKFYSQVGKCDPESDDSPILINRKVFYTTSEPEGMKGNLPTGSMLVLLNTVGNNLVSIKRSDGAFTNITLPEKFQNGIIIDVSIPGAVSLDNKNGDKTYSDGWKLTADEKLLDLKLTMGKETHTFNGPGQMVNYDITPNVSGYKSKVYKNWALYVGLGLVVTGLLLVIFLKQPGDVQKNTTSSNLQKVPETTDIKVKESKMKMD